MLLLQFDCGGDLILRSQDGKPIQSVDDWFRFAPPKRGAEQWRDGRSAKELARAWFRCPEASPPAELNRLLASHPALNGLVVEEAVPECSFDLMIIEVSDATRTCGYAASASEIP